MNESKPTRGRIRSSLPHGIATMVAGVPLFLSAILFAACVGPGGDPGDSESDGGPRVCEPGRVVECPCASQDPGVQQCADDGSRWSPCECNEPELTGPQCGPRRCAEGMTCVDLLCIPEGCANGVLDPGEECDDGNLINGDGCNIRCRLEGPVEEPSTSDVDDSDGEGALPLGAEECDAPELPEYAPGPDLVLNLCLVRYCLPSQQPGQPCSPPWAADDAIDAVAEAQTFYDEAGAGLRLVIHRDLVVEADASITDPLENETNPVFTRLWKDVTAADGACALANGQCDACDVAVALINVPAGLNGEARFPKNGKHVALVRRNPTPKTLAHELGHVFGIYHTHSTSAAADPCSQALSDPACWCSQELSSGKCSSPWNSGTCETQTCEFEAMVPGIQVLANAMSYYRCAYAATANSFTSCQVNRMRCVATRIFELDEVGDCQPGATRPCHPNPGVEGVGICAPGTERCQDNGQWSSLCEGWGQPVAEVCNNRDDDCNGVVDDEGVCGACSGEPNGTVISTSEWTNCSGFSSTCDETGRQERTREVCQDGAVIIVDDDQPCERDTDGIVVNRTAWTPCGGFSNACDETGRQTRDRSECQNGAQVTIPESDECDRDTDGDACPDGRCDDGVCRPQWSVVASPSDGWTARGPCDSANDRGIYQGRVTDNGDLDDNRVSLAFQKCDGTLPSQNVTAWVVVTDLLNPSDATLCTNGPCTRSTTQWSSRDREHRVANVSIWPSQAALEAAPCNDVKRLYIITDGRGVEGQRVWYQEASIAFRKVCE